MVSVIVPIYQAEKYIGKCISSIIEQTYSDFELILVDDGSADASYEICKSYAKNDNRLVLIHTENYGGAHARNMGLKQAKGEYVSFVDADDYLEPNFLERLVEEIQRYNADIAECDFYWIEDRMKKSESLQQGCVFEFDRVQAMKEHIADRMCRQLVWNKLYKKKLLQDIWFFEGKTIDDEFWTYRVIGNADKVIHICESLYNYVQHEASIMHQQYSLKRLQALDAQSLRLDYIREKIPDLRNYAEQMLYFACMYHMQMALKYLDRKTCYIAFRLIKDIIKKEFPDVTFIKEASIVQKIWVRMSQINFIYTCKIRNLLKIGV
ncbi:glycosyltransferase [Faecalicatena contorta]|nr:glycosyltransferase [Faecalicatena contorta]